MDHGLSLSSYRRYPLVLGVVGQTDGPASMRFFQEALDARVLVRTGYMEVRAVGPVEGLGTLGFHWGAAIHSTDRHPNWQDLSERLGAAGLFREDNRWVLFTDALGVNPVYLRENEGSLFFSTRMAPLIALPRRLSVDWSAWASIFVMGAPLGGETPFLEIRRLEGATGLALEKGDQTRSLSYAPSWLAGDIAWSDPTSLGEAVRAGLPPRSALPETPAIPLSGGWDSRLLAGLAARFYKGRHRAWTSATDDGRDLDVSFAADVAHSLGMRHTTVQQPDSGWPDLATETRIRAQFETWLHPWLTPLFRRMRNQEISVLDGLGGDVLIKGLFVTERLLESPVAQRPDRLFRRLGYQPDRRFVGRLRDGPAQGIVESGRQSFHRIAQRYSDHVNQLALTVLHTRTARVVAVAPTCLLAPEVKTWFPFLHPNVLGLSLSIGPELKTGGALYREVLRRCVPRVAELPSTNDPIPKPALQSRRLQASTEATSWMIDSVLRSSTLVDLFQPDLVTLLHEGWTWSERDPQIERLLMAGSLFAQWERFHRGRIEPSTPPW